MTRKQLRNVAAALVVIALAFWHPATRAVVLFILPLGRGIDDFVVMAGLLAGIVFLILSGLKRRKGK